MTSVTSSILYLHLTPIAGRKTLRLHTPGVALDGPGREPPKPFSAARDGFSLNAAVGCKAGERRKLQRLCRYVARPVIAQARLSRDGDGLVVYELKHPFRDKHLKTTAIYRDPDRRRAEWLGGLKYQSATGARLGSPV